jgi:O-acetyl-ADP-ribose deacetylase (regulator of RNase III)
MEIVEICGNLFDSGDCLAHCVSKDFSMSAGIAKVFLSKYGNKNELLSRNIDVGYTTWLFHENRYIYYLVTKQKYWHKPTYDSLRLTIRSLYQLCVEHSIESLSIPKLGCGLDKLEWDKVKEILIQEYPINATFKITMFYLD